MLPACTLCPVRQKRSLLDNCGRCVGQTYPDPERRLGVTSLFYVVSSVASMLIGILLTLMFIRAIFSWFPMDEDSPFFNFLYGVTEPFIMPVRLILERFELFRSMPLDMSFLITAMILSILRAFL